MRAQSELCFRGLSRASISFWKEDFSKWKEFALKVHPSSERKQKKKQTKKNNNNGQWTEFSLLGLIPPLHF